MVIAADKNIPLVQEAFGTLGTVQLLETSAIVPKNLRTADALLVRSETKVNQSLLETTPVQFVGTVTIGTDHLDLDFLRSKGISYASAPGCNANSVKEYLAASLLYLARTKNFTLKGKTIGIVGVGNVGRKIAALGGILGMEVVLNDPPLARETSDNRYVPLDDLMDCDIITLHVPLTKSGVDPTFHLFGPERFRQMKKEIIFINTSRGAVVETNALKNAIQHNQLSYTVLDVWENEPNIDRELLGLASLGTAHIAGYSLEGKVTGVRMVREAFCHQYKLAGTWNPQPYLDSSKPLRAIVPEEPLPSEEILHRIVQQSYDIAQDDTQLRRVVAYPDGGYADAFMKIRSGYRMRREFSNVTVEIPTIHLLMQNTFRMLGFNVSTVV